MVLTLPFVFLITVIFIANSCNPKMSPNVGVPPRLALRNRRLVIDPRALRHRLDLAVRFLDDRDFHDAKLRLAQVVDDDVHEPGTQGAVLLGVVRLFALHCSLLV
jgi:hypothetical protein